MLKLKGKMALAAMLLMINPAIAKEWTIKANFEKFSLGDKALGSSGFWGGAGQSEVVQDPELNRKAAKIWIQRNQTGYGKWGGEWRFPTALKKGDHVWFSAHTYFPEDFDYHSYGEGMKTKFLRIRTLGENNEGRGHNDFYINTKGSMTPFKFIYEGEQKWVDVGNKDDFIVKDKWENYQMYIVFDNVPKDLGGKAEVILWKDGKELIHITNRKTLKEEGDRATLARLFTYWNGGSPQRQSMYVDEIMITNKTPEWTDIEGRPIIPYFTDACKFPG